MEIDLLGVGLQARHTEQFGVSGLLFIIKSNSSPSSTIFGKLQTFCKAKRLYKYCRLFRLPIRFMLVLRQFCH